MIWTQPKFTPDGQIIISPMVGPWDQYEKGSQRWAEAIAAHLQGTCRRSQDPTDPKRITMVLKEALFSEPPPWEVWPEEAKGNSDAWLRMVTLLTWPEVEQLVTSRLGPEIWGPFGKALAEWEAKHRTHDEQPREKGRFTAGGDTPDGPRDHKSTRGIRRRLQKRVKAGDATAAELVERLSTGVITVNQAAIAAGMRQRYFRVPLVHDPPKVAAAIAKHFDRQEVKALCDCLLSITNNEQ